MPGEPPIRVLFVDDHPVILGVARLACEGTDGVEMVGEAEDADGALRLVADLSPDVVVLDMDLPGDGGSRVLAALRDEGFEGGVLALSDRTDGTTVLDALRLGARGYMEKGAGLRMLGEAIMRTAAGERLIDAELEQSAALELGRFARTARERSEVDAVLTPREREILVFISEGFTMQQIANRIGISPRTVETHVAKLYRKLGVRTRVQAVSRAASLGLIDLR